MTVPSTSRRAGPFTGTGVLLSYPFTFKVFEKADVQVTIADTNGLETLLVLDSTVLVTLNVDQDATPGGSVQYAAGGIATALPTGYMLAITGEGLVFDQPAELPQGGNFDPGVIEAALDRLEMQIQLVHEAVDRTLQVAVTTPTSFEATLPAPVPLTLLGWAADGLSLVNYAPDVSSAAGLQTRLANPTALADGDAMLGLGSITSTANGITTRHATLAAAVAAVGSTATMIKFRGAVSVPASVTIPATAVLQKMDDGVITIAGGQTLTINGRFEGPANTCFAGAGKVIFGRNSIQAVLPQWWGARGDAAIDGSSGTDCTTAIAAAVAATCENGISDVSIHPLEVGPGNWLTGNQTFPPAFRLLGAGRHLTNFIVKTGTTGKWFTDAGNAAKFTMRGFAMYGRNLAGLTHLLQLGRNGVEFGTEGLLDDLFIRDSSAAGSYGFDVAGNVGQFGVITVQACARNIRIGGAANQAAMLVSMAPTESGADISYTTVNGLHIEAPGNSCVPLLISRDSGIAGLSISLANSTTISHLIEIDSNATNWYVRNLNLFFGSAPAGVTVSNGNIKRADGSYCGGNATAGSLGGNGPYASDQDAEVQQSFTLRIVNTAGTLQHRICNSDGTASLSQLVKAISGATSALTNTPTGADGSTAMAAGGKIGSASTSIFYFDTVTQKNASIVGSVSITDNTTGTALIAKYFALSININGVTRTRFALQLLNAASGAAFAITTANITAGNRVDLTFSGYLSH